MQRLMCVVYAAITMQKASQSRKEGGGTNIRKYPQRDLKAKKEGCTTVLLVRYVQ